MQAEIQTFTIRLPKPVRVDAERLAAKSSGRSAIFCGA